MSAKKIIYKKQILRKKMITVMVYGIMFLIVTIAFNLMNTSNAQNVERITVSVVDEEAELDILNYELKIAEDEGEFIAKLPEMQNGFFVNGYKVVTEKEFRKVEKLYNKEDDEENEEEDIIEESNNNDEELETEEVNKEIIEENEENKENGTDKEITKIEINENNNDNSEINESKEEQAKSEKIEKVTENNNEESLQEKENSQNKEEDEEDKEIVPSGEGIILNKEQVESKQLFLVALYDYQEVDGERLYNKKISSTTEKNIITIAGYMPQNAEVSAKEVELEEVEEKIKSNFEDVDRSVKLASAYDIKIIIDDEEFEPEDFGENVKVYITGIENENINIWHIRNDDTVEMVYYEKNDTDIEFETDEFSIYGVETLEDEEEDEEEPKKNEDIGKKAPRKAGTRATGDSTLVINDYTSDYYYYMGKNYTDNIAGTNANTYSNSNLVQVTLNYHGFAYGETDNDMKGRISLDETEDIVQNIRCAPVESGNISVELMENPFMDKPTGYGFAGWTASNGIISTDSKTLTQTLTVQTNTDVTIDLYANWEVATVVFVNSTAGTDDGSYDGLTASTPFGSWSSAFNYLYSHNRNDRERNIIVVTGNVDCSINYTQPITRVVQRPATVTYNSSTSVVAGQTVLLATGNGAGANAITANGSSVSNLVLRTDAAPLDESGWVITVTGNGNNTRYTIRSAANSNMYLTCNSSGVLSVSTTQTSWRLNNRRFYYSSGNTNRYIRWDGSNWTTTTTQNSGTQFYFVRYTAVIDPNGEDIVSFNRGAMASNSNYTNNRSVPVTITSLYDHTDYRETATISLTTANYDDFAIYKDFQMNHVKISASGYTSNNDGTTFSNTYPMLFGYAHNVRLRKRNNDCKPSYYRMYICKCNRWRNICN